MKIGIIGGGGTRVPLLVGSLLDVQKSLDLTELSLIDTDVDRLTLMDRVVRTLCDNRQNAVRISHPGSIRECVTGSSFVIAAIRVGGDRLRALDERIPLTFGVLGQETVGAGGCAMAVRTAPVILDILKELQENAPDAWFINLTNPSGVITQAAASHSGFHNVVGICDEPASIATFLARLLQVEPDDIALDYYGLNHCGFVKSVYVLGRDVLPHVLSMIEKMPESERLTRFPVDYVQRLGKLPNSYIRYYTYRAETLQELERSGTTRGEEVERLNARLYADLKSTDDPAATYKTYLDAREEAYLPGEYRSTFPIGRGEGYAAIAVDVVLALAGKRDRVVPVDAVNRGAIEGLAPDDVVEVPCLITERLIRPLAVGPIDDDSRLLIDHVKLYERSLVDAIVYHDRKALEDALALNPLVPSPAVAKRLIAAYSDQEAPYFDRFT